MELPNLISKVTHINKNPEKREYFFAIEINPSLVKTAIWSSVNNKVQVFATGTSSVWDGKTASELTKAADASLSVCIQNLKSPTDHEPKKTVFGLPEEWVEHDKIKAKYQDFLKEITSQLDLKPIGFVVSIEAIIHHLKTTEGVPPSIILVGITEMHIDVTLVRLGQTQGTQTVARSVDLGQDLEEGLSRFQVSDVLPSRILLYDSDGNLEQSQQQLLAYPWQEKLAFLHIPKVEILPSDYSVKSVATSAGSEYLKSIGSETIDETTAPAPKPNSVEEVVEIDEDHKNIEDLGFVANRDISEALPQPEQIPPSVPETIEQKLPSKPKFQFPKIKAPSMKPLLSKFKMPGKGRFKLPSAPLFVIALLTAAGFVAGSVILPKATLTITVEPKRIDRQIGIIADLTAQAADPSAKIIPGLVVEAEISGEKSISTSGEITVGDKATGTVTIFNATPQTRTFPAGTVLTSPQDLVFVTNDPVTVASKSGTAISSQPGQANVAVTAEDIGSQYNIAAGSEFQVGTFSSSDVAAKNSDSFSGGSSREVPAVSETDRNALQQSLLEELESKAKDELNAKLVDNQILIDSSVETAIQEADFSHDVGQEASDLSLNLSIKAESFAVNYPDLVSVVESDLSSSVPEGYQLPRDNLSPVFTVKDSDGEKIDLDVTFTASLLPRISIDEVRSKISGKTSAAIEGYLKALPGYVTSKIETQPRFVPFLPFLPKNIEVIIKSDESS